MGKHQLRLVICAGAAIGLIVVSVLFIDWFRASHTLGLPGLEKLRVDLRTIHVVSPDGVKVSAPLSKLRGSFSSVATVTFWSSLVFAAIVTYQAGTRLLGGIAGGTLSRIGYGVGALALFSGLGAGYLFAPEGMAAGDLAVVTLQRTSSPAMLIAATILGFLALGFAAAEDDDDPGAYQPVVAATKSSISQGGSGVGVKPYVRDLPPAMARTKTPTGSPPIAVGRTKTPTGTPPIAVGRTKTPTGSPPKTPTDAPLGAPSTRSRSATGAPPLDIPGVGLRLKPPTGAPPIAAAEAPVQRPRVPDELPFDAAAYEAPPPDIDEAATIALPQQPQTKIAAPRAQELPEGNTPFVSAAPSAVTRVAAAITQEALRKKLAYATATATIEDAGLNARREDNLVKLIKWRDIVGAVARRLPAAAPYEGITFVDVVSAPGQTLRILPWTKLIGASLADAGDLRARAVIQLLQQRCPGLHIDPATRAFLGGDLPAQLPDEPTLEAHDRRLA